MKYVIAIALLLLCSPLHAGDVTVGWTAPTRNEACVDAGELENLAGFRIYEMIEDIPDPTVNTFVIANMKPGDYRYISTAYTDSGIESRASNSAEKTVTTFVTVAPDVYYVIAQPNRYLMVIVGNVPLGTECDATESVNGKHAVDIDVVNWTGTSRPLAVVAECG